MKFFRILSISLLWFAGFAALAQSGDHAHHAQHNMVLFGESEFFVSHIVYKEPHNFQVILKVTFDPQVRMRYLAEKSKFPKEQFIYLLDPLDIKNIASAASISGTIWRVDSEGARFEVAPDVIIRHENFELVYFNELPLSLSGS